MGYRDKPELWGEAPAEPRAKGYLWSLAGIMCFNLGLIGTNVARQWGWHVSAEVLEWMAIALGFACLAAGVFAYRAAKAQAQRDMDEMMPPNVRG